MKGDSRMETYLELEELKRTWKGEVCIFGAGTLGRITAYNFLKVFGFKISFYCDNFVPAGTLINNEILIRDNDYLYNNQETVLVFLCISAKYQKEVLQQLKKHGVKHIVIIDLVCISNILDSIEKSDNDVKKRYHEIYDDKEVLSKLFREKTGYDLDIENPRTFNEKLQWLKLHDRKPEYIKMVDKYEAKKYIANIIGEDYIIPTLDVYDTVDEIEFKRLPDQFVLKCTHDSGSVVICTDRTVFDQDEAKRRLNYQLHKNYYWIGGREWPYKHIKPRIMAENCMGSPSDLIDYKFMCFDGVPKMAFTCTERFEKDGMKVTFFDLEWNKMDFERHYPSSRKEINKPQNLQLMIELAGRLSAGIPFVRVDFYEIKGKVYFGEMTFFPGGGMEEFSPIEWDYKLGELINYI